MTPEIIRAVKDQCHDGLLYAAQSEVDASRRIGYLVKTLETILWECDGREDPLDPPIEAAKARPAAVCRGCGAPAPPDCKMSGEVWCMNCIEKLKRALMTTR